MGCEDFSVSKSVYPIGSKCVITTITNYMDPDLGWRKKVGGLDTVRTEGRGEHPTDVTTADGATRLLLGSTTKTSDTSTVPSITRVILV